MKRIYVAEDSPAQQDLVRAALVAEEGLQTSFFADGVELYRAVMERPPDLLLLDIIMPSLTGTAICRLLKFHEDYARIPVLMSSSIIDANIRERVRQAGAEMFLPKPYQPEALVESISKLLAPA